MNREEFFAANETIEFNPVKRLNTRVNQICDRILPADLRQDARGVIEGSRLTLLHTRARDAIESGRFHLIDGMLVDFANELLTAFQFELRSGLLKPWSASDEVKRCASAGYFERNLINGFEVCALRDGLEPGEQIDIHASALRAIKTDRREILRGGDFFDRLRLSGYSKEFWLRQCTSTARLAEAERMLNRKAEIASRPFSASSGPNAGESTVIQR
jgi:hypothetical protein